MRPRRIELALRPGVYVSHRKAQHLIADGHARLDGDGRLLLKAGRAADELLGDRVRWSDTSAGYVMQGRAINRAT